MRDAQKLAKALNEAKVSEAYILIMASVLLKFVGIDVALEFVHGLRKKTIDRVSFIPH